ncbi:uncharacterized protein LOC128883551 isoform X2 [Hylaeus volcanicus]|nr:uncharacterized protein LOC128883551 isoform X2 [Hylaeus volcanicus]
MEVHEERSYSNKEENDSNDEKRHINKQKSSSNASLSHTNNQKSSSNASLSHTNKVLQVKSALPQTLHHRTSTKLQAKRSHSIDSRNDDTVRTDEKANFITNFSQQKLHAWQPVLTTGWIVSFFFVFGFIFSCLGILLILTSNKVVECVYEYPDPSITNSIYNAEIRPEHCVGPFHTTISPPIYLYYELSNYYQNHRRYVNSRHEEQLRGKILTDASDASSCHPMITDSDGRILSPCGLAAHSVFNDSFTMSIDNENVKLDESVSVIAWSSDVRFRFKNPQNVPNDKVNEWLNEDIFPKKVENGHFIVWMRNAALPTFRKLYARIDQPLTLPLTVHITNRYPVGSFQGKKRVVLSTTSWLGGRNKFLGFAYIFIGAWCLIFGLFFCIKNYRKPRILGDVRYLKWACNRS